MNIGLTSGACEPGNCHPWSNTVAMEIASTIQPFAGAEYGAPKEWINGKALKGSCFFIHFNLKFIRERFIHFNLKSIRERFFEQAKGCT